MGSPERRQREREEMRQLICRTAMRIFLDEGFERTSIRRIAEAIEYTPGAIYSYYEDKDAILFALQTEGFALLLPQLQSVPDHLPPVARLRALARVYLRFALENPQYYDLMFLMTSTVPRPTDQRWQAGLQMYDLFRQQVAACQEASPLPGQPLEPATFAVWSMLHGMASLAVKKRLTILPASPETTAEIPALLDAAIDVALSCFAPAAG